jgi:hypothetical protein
MPLKVDPADRKLLLGGAAAFAIMLLISLLAVTQPDDKSEIATTYSSGSRGAKAAYLLLNESGYKLQRWQRSLRFLPEAAGKTLILADVAGAPTSEEREKLRQFLNDGGHVIVTGPWAAVFVPDAHVAPEMMTQTVWSKQNSLMPSAITRAAPQITLLRQATWQTSYFVLPLYGTIAEPVVVKYPAGKGEVIWWASATPLTNAGLKEPDNLEFFLACLGDKDRLILWDEYFHGYQDPEAGAPEKLPVSWIFIQLAFLSAAILLTFSRRSGPICLPAAEARLSPMEFVHTLGGLYERAGAAAVAVDVCYQRFRYWLTRRLGLAGNTSIDALSHAVKERYKLDDPRFAETLRQCEAARYDTRLSGADALRLVGQLYELSRKLKLSRSSPKENADGSGAETGATRS